MSYQSEAQLEDNLIKQLVNQGFNKVKIANEEELKNNFRNELFEHNKSKLNNNLSQIKNLKEYLDM